MYKILKMDVLGIIPARYASTRLEGKPLVDICGKSMIQRVYEQANKALQHVVVATDDKRIEKAVLSFGGNVVMTSSKHKTGTNRCLEAYKIFSAQSESNFDIVINIQGDEPLLESRQLEQLISCFDDDTVEISSLVIPVKHNEDLFKSGVYVVLDKYKNALYFSRSVIPFVRDTEKTNWQKEHTFYKHVGLYAFTPKSLKQFSNLEQTSLEKAESLEQNRWLENGNLIRVAITEFETIAIDTQEDLERVRTIIGCN